MELVVDCCALVHAKEMSDLQPSPLAVLESLADRGVRFVTTSKVYQEMLASSLSTTLQRWQGQGWISTQNVSSTERKAVKNELKKGDVEPGDNDKALIALAKRLKAPLLTHDEAESILAQRRCKVTVVDLADLMGLADRLGLTPLAEASKNWGPLDDYEWPVPFANFQGSLEACLAARPGLTQLLNDLEARIP